MVRELGDEELVRRFQAGDARAFEVLLRRHRTLVYAFVLRFTGDRARAEDLLQETWLKVVRSLPAFEPRARFTTWALTVARNVCLDSLRREAFRKTEALEGGPAVAEVDAASPERAAHAARLRPVLEAALASLPAEQREVFVMREYAGQPFKEIAAITGVAENTVKSRMRYALEGLRRALAAAGVDGDLADELGVAS